MRTRQVAVVVDLVSPQLERLALTGGTVSEPVNELLYVVGKDEALKRLEEAARKT